MTTTPDIGGPWEAVFVKEGHHSIVRVNDDPVRKFCPICEVDNSSDGYEPMRTVTNPARARLIAAAPEMGAMLLSIFSHVSHGGPTRAEGEALLKKAGLL